MIITNKYNLPDAIVKAIENDDYDPGHGDISCTTIIGPPKINFLKQRHGGEVTEDASDRIWALVGQIGHGILDRAELKSEVTEKRLYMTVLGWELSGQFDNLHIFNGVLTDYKFTSYYACKDGMKPEWSNQLNVLACLLQMNGYEVKAIQIVAILKDWKRSEAKYNKSYPQVPVMVIPGNLLTLHERKKYIHKRMELHQSAVDLPDDQLPPCTDEERWCVPGRFAVMSGTNKKASKLCNTHEEAEGWIKAKDEASKSFYVVQPDVNPVEFHVMKGTNKKPVFQSHYLDEANDYADSKNAGLSKFNIIERPTLYNRCADYCSINAFCNQHQATLKESTDGKE